jgi:hypothetical protein
MHRITLLLLVTSALASGGCVVHDRTGSPEPIWWPNFVVRESTLAPANGNLNLQTASPLLPPVSADSPVGRFADRPFEPRNGNSNN